MFGIVDVHWQLQPLHAFPSPWMELRRFFAAGVWISKRTQNPKFWKHGRETSHTDCANYIMVFTLMHTSAKTTLALRMYCTMRNARACSGSELWNSSWHSYPCIFPRRKDNLSSHKSSFAQYTSEIKELLLGSPLLSTRDVQLTLPTMLVDG